MPKQQYRATFDDNLTASAGVQSAIIAALTSDEARKARNLKCRHVIAMVKNMNGIDEDDAINGLKVLANAEEVIIGPSLRRRQNKNGLRRKIKFELRTIKLSHWLKPKPDEKLIYCGGEQSDSSVESDHSITKEI